MTVTVFDADGVIIQVRQEVIRHLEFMMFHQPFSKSLIGGNIRDKLIAAEIILFDVRCRSKYFIQTLRVFRRQGWAPLS